MQMRTYRVRRQSVEPHHAARRALLDAVEISEANDATILRVAGEALLVLPTLGDMLAAMDLTLDDIEERA